MIVINFIFCLHNYSSSSNSSSSGGGGDGGSGGGYGGSGVGGIGGGGGRVGRGHLEYEYRLNYETSIKYLLILYYVITK